MPLNPPEVWTQVKDPTALAVGDQLRIVEKYSDVTVTYVGPLRDTIKEKDELAYLGQAGQAAWIRPASQAVVGLEIQKLEPPFEFPPLTGSAILVYDGNYLTDRVLLRDDEGQWGYHDGYGNHQVWEQTQILGSNPRVLFDPRRG